MNRRMSNWPMVAMRCRIVRYLAVPCLAVPCLIVASIRGETAPAETVPVETVRIAIPKAVPAFEEGQRHEMQRPSLTFEPDDAPSENTIVRAQSAIPSTAVSGTLGERAAPPIGPSVTPVPDILKQPLTIPGESREDPMKNDAETSPKPLPGKQPQNDGDRELKTDESGAREFGWDTVGNTGYLFCAILGWCLFAYSLFLVIDFRSRWIEAITTQNNRLSQSLDLLTDGIGSEFYATEPGFRREDADPLYGGIRFDNLPEFSFK